jgi:hypothetical protein
LVGRFNHDAITNLMALPSQRNLATGREIEFEISKLPFLAMIDKVAGVAVGLVERGSMVRDGDTFEGDERERFTVHHKNPDWFGLGGMPVFFCAADLAS